MGEVGKIYGGNSMAKVVVNAKSLKLGEISAETTWANVIEAGKFKKSVAKIFRDADLKIRETVRDADKASKLKEDDPSDQAILKRLEEKYGTYMGLDDMKWNDRLDDLANAMQFVQQEADASRTIDPIEEAARYIELTAGLTKKKAESLKNAPVQAVVAVATELSSQILGQNNNSDDDSEKSEEKENPKN